MNNSFFPVSRWGDNKSLVDEGSYVFSLVSRVKTEFLKYLFKSIFFYILLSVILVTVMVFDYFMRLFIFQLTVIRKPRVRIWYSCESEFNGTCHFHPVLFYIINDQIFTIFRGGNFTPNFCHRTSQFLINKDVSLCAWYKGKLIYLKVFSRRGLISNSEHHMFRRSYRYVVPVANFGSFQPGCDYILIYCYFLFYFKETKCITRIYLFSISYSIMLEICLHSRSESKSPI